MKRPPLEVAELSEAHRQKPHPRSEVWREFKTHLPDSSDAEYEEVINRPRFRRSEEIIAGALQAIREKGLWVRPTERVTACSDPDDDIFLECAQAAKAEYLVNGNLKHFPVSWAGSRMVTPRWLLDSLSAQKPE